MLCAVQESMRRHPTAEGSQQPSAGASAETEAPAAPQITASHLQAALRATRPSVSRSDRAVYERLRDKLLCIRSHITSAPSGDEDVAVDNPVTAPALRGAPSAGPSDAAKARGDAPADDTGPRPMDA